jgi:hypothetical protein
MFQVARDGRDASVRCDRDEVFVVAKMNAGMEKKNIF